MTIENRSLHLFLLSLFLSFPSSLIAQESSWVQLLKEADRGEKSLAELISQPSSQSSLNSPEDFNAIAKWIKSIDIAELPRKPQQIANIETVLTALNGLTPSDETPSLSQSVQAVLEQQLNELLRLNVAEFEPLESVAFSALRFVLIQQSKQSSSLLLAATENKNWQQSSYWSEIFYAIPETNHTLQTLQSRILQGQSLGRVAVSLVEFENDLAFDDSNHSHFLSRAKGSDVLREWLNAAYSQELQRYGAAKQAAVSLAFVQCRDWEELIRLARQHPDPEVVLEAAWAGARRGDEDSISHLVELARDVRYSLTAVSYLREINLEARIPTEAEEPAFLARAELARWLAYPTEKGRPPDELKIIDSRQLKWPLEDEPVNVYLIQYTYKNREDTKEDEVDIGFVGPMTFCHFDMKMMGRPHEDIYAIHVYRELEAYELLEDIELEQQPGAFDYLLKMWKGDPLENCKLISVARLEPSVDYPRRLLGLARAQKRNEEGFVVLDGPRSQWYPQKALVSGTPEKSLLIIHLGRQLLGFNTASE